MINATKPYGATKGFAVTKDLSVNLCFRSFTAYRFILVLHILETVPLYAYDLFIVRKVNKIHKWKDRDMNKSHGNIWF